MKKFTKVLLIIAAICVALGLGLAAAGAALGGMQQGVTAIRNVAVKMNLDQTGFFREVITDGNWSSHHLDGRSVSPVFDDGKGNREYEIEGIRSLELGLEYEQLELIPWEKDSVQVKVENDKGNSVEVAVDEGCLEIVDEKQQKNRKVIVSYPQDQRFDSVEIFMGAGEVTISGTLTARELEAEVGAGIFESQGEIDADSVSLEVGAGQMQISYMDAEKIDGECGLGEIQLCLAGKTEDYNFDLECGLGQIQVGDDSYSSFASQHHSQHENAGRWVSLECGMGEIQVSFRGQ